MSAITVSSDLIHYEVLGRGRPVVLVHGWIGSWRYWVPTMQQLQLKFRVYALDLYGFGDSAKNPNKYTLEHQIALLDDFMQQLGLPKAALIGHGLGALVVTEFARRYQERVPRLLVVSAPLFNPGDLERRIPAAKKVLVRERPAFPQPQETGPNSPTVMSPSAAMRAALIEAARARKAGQPLPQEFIDMTVQRTEVAEPAPIENPLQNILNGGSLDVLLGKCFRRNEPSFEKLSVDVAKTDARAPGGIIGTFDPGSMLDTYVLLPMPTVIIHGADDPIMPTPDEDVWNYVTKDRENLVLPIPLPGVRHFPMLEDERFFRIVNDFLELPDISKIEVKERWRRRTR